MSTDVPAADFSVEAEGTVTNPEPDEAPPGETLSDEEILRRIQAEFANRPAPPTPPKVSITDLYQQMVTLVATAAGYRTAKLRSETNATKILELALMWALNQRDRAPSHDIIPTEELTGEEETSEAEGPEPDELITASDDQSDPTEES